MSALPRFGVQIATNPRCKICNSPHRAEIEDVLWHQKAGDSLPNGIRPTLKWIAENSERMWGMVVNEQNIQAHWKRHFQATGAGVAEAEEANQAPELVFTSVDEMLQDIVAAAHLKIKVDPEKVTVDQGLKAAAELTKRKHDETTGQLMMGLAGAIGGAIQRIPLPEPKTADAEVEAVEVVDAEVVPDGE